MNRPQSLSSQQRAWLRKQAHHLSAIVSIGQAGVSDAVEASIKEALAHHELIKIKFYSLKDEKQDACNHIAHVCGAEIIGIVGNIGIFYKQADLPERRHYHIPVKKASTSTTNEEI